MAKECYHVYFCIAYTLIKNTNSYLPNLAPPPPHTISSPSFSLHKHPIMMVGLYDSELGE